MDATQKSRPVSSREYNDDWIKETWGWDAPEHFIKTQGRNLRPRILAGLEVADLKPGMRILDIGCGRGEVVLHCGRLGMEAIGIDYSTQALELAEQAKATHSPQEQDRMQFVCDDIKSLKIDEPFDRIFMLDVVEHLYDWELAEVFKVCHRLLKPSGILIIHTLPNKWLYEITYRRIVRLFMSWLPADPRTEKEKTIHVNEMTIIHLSHILGQAEFKSRVWLQECIVEQAHWHKKQPLQDRRGMIYKWFNNTFVGFLYKILAKTPLRLLIVNEIFAVAWKSGEQLPIKTPLSLTERFIIALQRRRYC